MAGIILYSAGNALLLSVTEEMERGKGNRSGGIVLLK
jgi:hypothetical protein